MPEGSTFARIFDTVSRSFGSGTSAAASGLFRVEAPTGSTLRSLVPAVGGGFRGLVGNGSGKIAGHTRLVPAAGAAAVGGAALAPVLAVLALSIGAEMLARHQQDKKLEEIRRGVEALRRADDEQIEARLVSAEQALKLGEASLLDCSVIPNSIGLGEARNGVRDVMNRAVGWLDGWESGLKKLQSKEDPKGTSFDAVRTVLAGENSGKAYLGFPSRVRTLYRALVLDSRSLTLHGSEAALSSPNIRLDNLQRELQDALERNAVIQERLVTLLWRLTEEPLRVGWFSKDQTEKDVTMLDRTLARLAAGVTRLPDAPALLAPSGRQMLDVVRQRDGSVRILQPLVA